MKDLLPYADIPPRSLLIVRERDAGDAEAIKAKVDPTTIVLPAARDTEVFCVTEPTLNEAGWVHRTEIGDQLAEYSGKDSHRDWWSGGAWLYPGDRVVVVRSL